MSQGQDSTKSVRLLCSAAAGGRPIGCHPQAPLGVCQAGVVYEITGVPAETPLTAVLLRFDSTAVWRPDRDDDAYRVRWDQCGLGRIVR